MSLLFWLLVLLGTLIFLVVTKPRLTVFTSFVFFVLVMSAVFGMLGGFSGFLLVALSIILLALFNLPTLRKRLVSGPLLRYVRRVLPPMSETERVAIDAGTVWWEADLFQGEPEWQKLLDYPSATLTDDEQAFLDGPAETLCSMMNDWEITWQHNDLPEDVWRYIKDQRFLGMVIPKEYGGLGFSPMAHSEVVTKLATRSITGAVSVMVPNSLGPAELLLHYGTDEQKTWYLPRLSRGEDIPCFALTGPTAGSDAGAMPDFGVVCYGELDGQRKLGLKVTWNKRYITLGPIATVLGLAFKAYDPDHLLGDQEDLGITCALIPTDTKGVNIGRRHFPLNSAFMNGPNSGTEVFIPMDWIIGGQPMLGQGWRMLMDSLAVGRGISLPSMGIASGKSVSRFVGAYSRVRTQFNLPIGRFEGVEEALGRIAGYTYIMDAGRRLTCAALNQGEKPSVISAILKYYNTESMRSVVNDGMDIIGGRGICLGPGNFLGRAYQTVPVGITVEGANILTRSMIIFGQGAMRCHPYLVEEINAASSEGSEALDKFDEALMGHIRYAVTNGSRACLLGLTKSRWFAKAPVTGPHAKYYQRLSRFSSAYAFLADFAMLFLGGSLKRKEMLSGRFADGLVHLYMASAVLKRFEETGRPAADESLMEWSVRYCLFQIQVALDQILRNFPSTLVGLLLRGIVFPLGRRYRTPNDKLTHKCASLLLTPSEARDRLTEGVYLSDNPEDVTGSLEHALGCVVAAEDINRKLRKSGERKQWDQDHPTWVRSLQERQLVTEQEAQLLIDAEEAVTRVIQVDDFPHDFSQGG